MRVVSQLTAIRTQNPKPLEVRSPVVGLAEVQLVTSIPI